MDELTRDKIDEWIFEAPGPVVVDVWGPDCKPCLALAPTYQDLAERYANEGRFLKLEAPKNRMACVDLRVMGLPTFLIYSDGVERSRISGEGLRPVDLESWLASELSVEKGGE